MKHVQGAQRAQPSQHPQRPQRARRLQLLLLLPPLAVLFAFFVAPYLNMLYISFMSPGTGGAAYSPPFTLGNYVKVLSDSFNWKILWRTYWYAILTTVICLVVGYPLAYHLARSPSRMKGILMILLLSPLLVGVVIRSYGWMILLADKGLINSMLIKMGLRRLPLMYNPFGVMVGLVHIYLPFMVLSLSGALEGIHPDLELAARNLGAGGWSTFWRVTWPLSLPGVFAGSVLVFVLAASAYVIPALLGGNAVVTMPLLVVQRILDLFNWPLGSAIAMFMFAFTIALLWSYVKLMNRAMKGLV